MSCPEISEAMVERWRSGLASSLGTARPLMVEMFDAIIALRAALSAALPSSSNEAITPKQIAAVRAWADAGSDVFAGVEIQAVVRALLLERAALPHPPEARVSDAARNDVSNIIYDELRGVIKVNYSEVCAAIERAAEKITNTVAVSSASLRKAAEVASNALHNYADEEATRAEEMLDAALSAALAVPVEAWRAIETIADNEKYGGPALSGSPWLLYDPKVRALHPDWYSDGVVEGFWQDGEGWLAAIWNNDQDCWESIVVHPTHFRAKPDRPRPLPPGSV